MSPIVTINTDCQVAQGEQRCWRTQTLGRERRGWGEKGRGPVSTNSKFYHGPPMDLCSVLLQRAELGQRGNSAKRQIWIRIKKDFLTGEHIHNGGSWRLGVWAPEGTRAWLS